MRAVITVVGEDKIGIIAKVSNILADNSINISDISQTILQGFFTMIMIVDLDQCEEKFETVQGKLEKKGEEMGMSVRIQHEDIFKAMHSI